MTASPPPAPSCSPAAPAAALGWFAPQYPGPALVAGLGVLLLGISALRAVAVPLLALPLLYVAARVVYGGTDISVSDVALAIGTLCALLFVRHPISAPGRNLLWLVAIYQSATLFTVVANPYLANTLDWARSGLLIAGGLILGWSVGRSGMGGVGLKLMLAAALVLATWTIVVGVLQALQGDFRPVYLQPGMHKNFLGTVMGITALIAYVRPARANLSRRAGVTAFWWLAIGIGFTQSRRAVVALGVALIVLVLRSRTDRRRSKVILLGIVPALVVVFTLVRDRVSSDNVHNSVFQRLTRFRDAIDIWQTSPIVGVGLRWWYTDRFPGGFQPPNAELEVLTSAGILGLLGFLVLMVGTIVVLWKLPLPTARSPSRPSSHASCRASSTSSGWPPRPPSPSSSPASASAPRPGASTRMPSRQLSVTYRCRPPSRPRESQVPGYEDHPRGLHDQLRGGRAARRDPRRCAARPGAMRSRSSAATRDA
ncbi:O-antigen ligase family protein [Janibacter limosus]|uniref:O-antigen ligase family protein n=1 Tax=Janibacter limosus TaxID=53458 RepID=A0AC61U218_9MICO|nr:O-antigen ligase family protein [Janibacter limosus]UUZ44055.1 O-antigen ligase family protein [Janibacter limosus]